MGAEVIGRSAPLGPEDGDEDDAEGFVPKDVGAHPDAGRARRLGPWVLVGIMLLLLPVMYMAGRDSAPEGGKDGHHEGAAPPPPTFPPLPNADASAREPTPLPSLAPVNVPVNSAPIWSHSEASGLSQQDRERVSRALEKVRQARADLLSYYEGDKEILSANIKAPEEDELLAAKMAKAVLAPAGQRTWVVASVGSSVTAGHDTFESCAYPEVLGRQMRPLWEALEVNFTVRNQAVGGRGPNPWFICMRQMVGDDVDIVTREWEYWPFDDFLDPTASLKKQGLAKAMSITSGRDISAAAIEAFMRYTLDLRNQPALHFVHLDHRDLRKVGWFSGFLSASGALSAYRQFSMNAFDCFGKAFNHFPQRSGQRLKKDGKTPCGGRDISDCPIAFPKQDGYHVEPQWLGFDPKEKPDWYQVYKRSANKNLFTNWHPAPLGHEVMGNQLAYYQMGVLQMALETLLSPQFSSDWVEAKAAVLPLPSPAVCSRQVCNPQFPARCAISVQPEAQGPHIGDWVVNGSSPTKWADSLVMGQRDAGASCRSLNKQNLSATVAFNGAKGCSYRDAKHGFVGTKDSGLLTLGFSGLYQCLIFIGDSQYEWFRPKVVADWTSDVIIRLNGNICQAPVCTHVIAGGEMHAIWIDAKAEMGSACRRETVQVSFEVAPAKPDNHTCVPNSFGKCKLAGLSGYRDTDWCVKKAGSSSKLECTAKARYSNASEIVAYVSVALAF